MVIRKRIRAIVLPILLYAVSGAVGSYFVWSAYNGDRGIRTKDEYRKQIAALRNDLDSLRAERADWQQRVVQMRSESVDRDLAEEEARLKLDYVDGHDVVIFTGARRN